MPTFDAAGPTTQAGTGTSTSFSHTCTGSDRWLHGVMYHGNGAPLTLGAWTYNGVTMPTTKVNENRFASKELVAPAAGANTLAMAWTENSNFRASSVSYTGVHQTTPSGTAVTANGDDTSPTVDVTTVSGEMVVDAVGVQDEGLTAGAGQTVRLQATPGGGDPGVACSEEIATGASTTMSWTHDGFDQWSIGAFVLNAAAGGGGPLDVMAYGHIKTKLRPAIFSPGLAR